MSIYPVRLSEWFPIGNDHHETMKFLVSNGYTDDGIGCKYCKKKHMHWQDAWGHHSLPWGYGDIWCRKKCLDNYIKKVSE